VIEGFFLERGVRGVRIEIPKSNPPVRQRIELVNGRMRSRGGWIVEKVDLAVRGVDQGTSELVQFVAGTCEIDKTKDLEGRTAFVGRAGATARAECRDTSARIRREGRGCFSADVCGG
jgi:hypothetical protein